MSVTRKVMDTFQERALMCTVQLYFFESENNYPRPLASGILLDLKSHKYLLTAGHLYNDNEIERIVVVDEQGDAHRISGEIMFTKNNESQINNSFDIAFVRLDTTMLELFEQIGKSFLESNDIIQENTEDELYFLLGFPASRTKIVKSQQRVKITPFRLLTGPKIVEIKHYPPENNIFLEYSRKGLVNEGKKDRIIGPKLDGMSGCGIWALANDSSIRFKLHAILIENRKERSLIIGTRMNMIVKQIYNTQLAPPGE